MGRHDERQSRIPSRARVRGHRTRCRTGRHPAPDDVASARRRSARRSSGRGLRRSGLPERAYAPPRRRSLDSGDRANSGGSWFRPERAAFRRRRRGCSFGRSSDHLTVEVPAAGRCARTEAVTSFDPPKGCAMLIAVRRRFGQFGPVESPPHPPGRLSPGGAADAAFSPPRSSHHLAGRPSTTAAAWIRGRGDHIRVGDPDCGRDAPSGRPIRGRPRDVTGHSRNGSGRCRGYPDIPRNPREAMVCLSRARAARAWNPAAPAGLADPLGVDDGGRGGVSGHRLGLAPHVADHDRDAARARRRSAADRDVAADGKPTAADPTAVGVGVGDRARQHDADASRDQCRDRPGGRGGRGGAAELLAVLRGGDRSVCAR